MNDAELNPYSPPKAGRHFDSTGFGPVKRPILVTAASTFVAIGFAIFTVLLLRSASGDDIKAGQMFALNVPILMAAAIFTNKRRIAAGLGLLAVFVQLTITTVMLWKSIGSPVVVVGINGAIMIPLVMIALRFLISAKSQTNQNGHRRNSEQEISTDGNSSRSN